MSEREITKESDLDEKLIYDVYIDGIFRKDGRGRKVETNYVLRKDLTQDCSVIQEINPGLVNQTTMKKYTFFVVENDGIDPDCIECVFCDGKFYILRITNRMNFLLSRPNNTSILAPSEILIYCRTESAIFIYSVFIGPNNIIHVVPTAPSYGLKNARKSKEVISTLHSSLGIPETNEVLGFSSEQYLHKANINHNIITRRLPKKKPPSHSTRKSRGGRRRRH